MPAAITPPPVEAKSAESLKVPRPTLQRFDTSYMGTKRKIICFSDFDGTIMMEDSGHILFNNHGCGSEQREILDEQIKTGERSFRDVSEDMWGSLNVPFADGFETMKDQMHLDEAFQDFHTFCLNNKIPFNIISAGLKPVLREVLDHFLGEEASSQIDIVANDAEINEDGSEWKVIWRHDTPLGHDKALSINEYKDSARLESEDGSVPMIVFIGDGVSDLPAAREADVLFARRGLALEEYCVKHKLAYIPYDSFADIQREIITIARLDDQKTHGKGLPSNFNPRANLWRRASSRAAVPVFALKSPGIKERQFLWPGAFAEPAKPIAEAQAVQA